MSDTQERTQVWTLTIEHRHGTETRVFRTEEAAHAGLMAYVREWWTVDLGWSDRAPLTREAFNALSDAEQIIEYFERGPGYEESYCLDTATIEG